MPKRGAPQLPGSRAFGKWLARRREDLGIKQKDFALDHLRWSVATLRRLEHGQRGLYDDGEIMLLARELEVPEEILVAASGDVPEWPKQPPRRPARDVDVTIQNPEHWTYSSDDLGALQSEFIARGQGGEFLGALFGARYRVLKELGVLGQRAVDDRDPALLAQYFDRLRRFAPKENDPLDDAYAQAVKHGNGDAWLLSLIDELARGEGPILEETDLERKRREWEELDREGPPGPW